MNTIQIRKVALIKGKSLIFRNACVADTAFIFNLRMDAKKSRHLSTIPDDLSLQKKWLQLYEKRKDEAYFIIENPRHVPLGTIRLYDSIDTSFSWGSWILKDGSPANAAIESALMVYSYAIEYLGFRCAHFQVHKLNTSVCKFHERFGAIRVSENELQYEYTLSNESIILALKKYCRYLPDGILVEEIKT